MRMIYVCEEEEKELGRKKASGACPYCGGTVEAVDIEGKGKLFCLPICLRECNRAADSLANYGLKCRGTVWMNNFMELPKNTRGEIKVDKMQLPSFRNSIVKNSIHVHRPMYRNYLR
ncbi:uncharacterized protein LOC132602163 [Lycium barbarum]|uniref:uncharacterized protein LOC132602163 n=1 Tax=Lycium barbarum TaxID=112863 RepID=UPI00293E7082|nr:uncharacterized protein LOC132602163 [Lycium barbarum]